MPTIGTPWVGTADQGNAAGSNATSATVDITGAADGAVVYTFVYLSDAQTGTPTFTGWTLVNETTEGTTGSASSRLSVFKRTKISGDTTFGISWAVSCRRQIVPVSWPGSGAEENLTFLAHTSGVNYVTGTAAPTNLDRRAVGIFADRGTIALVGWTDDAALTDRVNVVTTATPWTGLLIGDTNADVTTTASRSYTAVGQNAAHGIAAIMYLTAAPINGKLIRNDAGKWLMNDGTSQWTWNGYVPPGASATGALSLSGSSSAVGNAGATGALSLGGYTAGPFLADNFNRPDEALGIATGNWQVSTTIANCGQIVSGQVVGGTVGFAARYKTPTISNKVFSQLTWIGGSFVGPSVAMDAFNTSGLANAAPYYTFRPTATAYQLVLKDAGAGTYTVLAPLVRTPVSGDVLRLEYDGTTLTCYINGSSVLTHNPTSPISIAAQPYVGLSHASSAQTGTVLLDDWTGGDPTTAPALTGNISATGALSLSGSSTGAGNGTATGALVLAGSSSARADASATGALLLDGTATSSGAWSATGALTLNGSSAARGNASATGALALSGSSAGVGQASATGALSLSGTSSWTSPPATGALLLSGSSTPRADASATGALALAGSSAARGNASATGALTLGGGSTASAGSSATGAILLAGSSSARANASATGALLLGGTVSGSANTGATGALALSGSWSFGAPLTATGALALSGGSVATAGTSATGALALSGSAIGKAVAAATGALALAGTAGGKANAAATGALLLGGTVNPRANAGATGALTLGGSAVVVSPVAATGALVLSGGSALNPGFAATGILVLNGSSAAKAGVSALGVIVLNGSISGRANTGATGELILGGDAIVASPHKDYTILLVNPYNRVVQAIEYSRSIEATEYSLTFEASEYQQKILGLEYQRPVGADELLIGG